MNWIEWSPQENILMSIKDVLQEALIPDSEIQRNVQDKLTTIQNLTDFAYYLLFILRNRSYSEEVRSLSGILLKNNISNLYGTFTEENIIKIREECLGLLNDPCREVRQSISNIIIFIAKDSLKTWPDLLNYLLKAFTCQEDYSEIALTTLSRICEDLITNQKPQDEIFTVTKEVFPKLVNYLGEEKCTMKYAIVKLTNQFMQDYFQIMKQSIDMNQYLRYVMNFANSDDVEMQKNVCHTFLIFVDNQEEAVLPHLHDVIVYLLDKSQSDNQDLALQACEFWLSTTKLSSCKEILSGYIDKLLPILLKNMKYSKYELNIIKDSLGSDANNEDLSKDITPFHFRDRNNSIQDEYFSDDEGEQHSDDFDDFYIGWTLRKCSAASLDSLAVKFGDDLLTVLVPYLNEILHHDDYLIKESAILALGAIAEGCMNGLKPHLPFLTQFLITAMNQDHSIVRVITCWTLSRYVNWIVNVENSPNVYFIPVMTILVKHFIDDNKRVQRAALSAFCIFEEEAQLKLVPYIDFILEGFQLGFQKFHYRSLYLLYDAIGVLAQSVGNQLCKEEYVLKLMPPLMQKFSECDNYYDDHFIAVLECLSNLIPALETSFLPYSEVVYCHCLQLINDTLIASLNFQENPAECDPPDKEPMNVAHDVLYSMAMGLKDHFIKYVTNSNLITLLYTTMQDGSNLIRQTSIALYGELVMLCFPLLATNISDYIPLIVKNLDEHYDGVCNNAAWVIGKLCSVMGSNIRPYLTNILAAFIFILKSPAIHRTMHKTVAISLCTVFYVCPDVNIPDIDEVIKNCCMLIRNVRDSDEKDLAFRGLCQVVARHQEFRKNNFIFFCDAVASWNNIRMDLSQMIQDLLKNVRQQYGEEKWNQFYTQFPEPLKAKLQSLYGV
ncbi:transportin-2-like [Aethina tumida]|uniref:transportin-2-like n=1 Tax=Aethina tumida TaxID=116153 RepID=UPI002147BDB5|nr:transportin-2-like [Aethina tumida]